MYVLAKCGSTSTGSAVSAIKRSDDELTRALFKPWPVDINGDMELETYHFTREPLVVDVCCAATDKVRTLSQPLNAHTTSDSY